jgi:isoleucyl-tRNA synthetase
VFGQLFEKNLVYRGYKVMPFSTALSTPLSNFEANQEMKEVTDPAGVCACAYSACIYFVLCMC